MKLSTFENNKFKTIKNISPESFTNLKFDSEVIKLSHSQLVIFKYLQLNLKEYSKFIDKTKNLPITQIDIRKISSPSYLLETNKIILNLLSSFKFFLDNAETFLKRKYGSNSEKSVDFIKLTNDLFNKSFAYRFLTKLRNYSIHLGFPFQGLSFETNHKAEKDPEKMIGEIQFLLDLELLKKERKLFGSIVNKDLDKLKSDIDIKPLIYDLSLSILDIQKYIFSIQQNELEQSIENIESFVGNHKTKSNDIKVFSDLTNNKNTTSFNVYHIPYEMINDIKTYKTGANNV